MTEEEIKKEDINSEESELEEELKETNIDEDRFRDVFIDINFKSPSLEKVAILSEPIHELETDLEKTPKSEKENVEYVIGYEEKKEKSYSERQEINSDNFIINPSLSRARDNPRDIFEFEQKQNFKINPQLSSMKKMQEDYLVKSPSEDFQEFKTHDPFKKIKKDYEFR